MTAAATQFVGPVTFEAITRRRVITDQFEPGANADIEHIALASSIDLLLIAPATANIIGKLANGLADDFLSTLYTATRAPVVVAPAMNTQMFAHEAVRRNMDRSRRAACASSSRAKAIWRAAGSARDGSPSRTRSWRRRRRCSGPRDRCAARGSWSRPVPPTRTSIRCATSATDRAAAWGSRSPAKRRAAAPR